MLRCHRPLIDELSLSNDEGSPSIGPIDCPTTLISIGRSSSRTTPRSFLGEHVPTRVTGGLRFSSINSGGITACGVSVDASGYCWRDSNALGELGNGSDSADPVSSPALVVGGSRGEATARPIRAPED